MSFLLSTSKVTDDPVEYAKDALSVELLTVKNSIPYSQIGIDHLIDKIDKRAVIRSIEDKISSIVTRVSSDTPQLSISIQNINYSNGTAFINISINQETFQYEVTTGV